jgi:probable rRNA maturation factor
MRNKMPVKLDVQYAESQDEPPPRQQLEQWANLAFRDDRKVEVSLRIVGEEESRSLNHSYRGKNKSTNVLSFPMDLPAEFGLPLLGDLVICAPVVEREAVEQNKSSEAHWAHMVIHGMLHLQGYDHESNAEAEEMEDLEIRLMQQLNYPDPYQNDSAEK